MSNARDPIGSTEPWDLAPGRASHSRWRWEPPEVLLQAARGRVRGGGRVRHRRPKKKGPNPMIFVFGGLALGLTIVLWQVAVNASDDKEQEEQTQLENERAARAAELEAMRAADAEPVYANPLDHPASKRIGFFAKNAANHNTRGLAAQLHLPSWYARRAEETAPAWTAVPRKDRETFGQEIATELTADDDLRRFAGLDLTNVIFDVETSSMVQLTAYTSAEPDALWRFALMSEGEDWFVSAFSRSSAEAERLAAAEAVGTEESDALKTAREQYEEKTFVKTDDGGRIFKGVVEEVDLVEGTTDAERKRYEQLIDLALSDDGLESRSAARELRAVGQKAVPALLNRLVAIPLDGSDARMQAVAAVDGLLQDVTWRTSALPLPALSPDPPEVLRQKQQWAVEAWFGWWKNWGHRWEAWAEEAGIPEPDPRRRGNG